LLGFAQTVTFCAKSRRLASAKLSPVFPHWARHFFFGAEIRDGGFYLKLALEVQPPRRNDD
jgi:hypothetical protein